MTYVVTDARGTTQNKKIWKVTESRSMNFNVESNVQKIEKKSKTEQHEGVSLNHESRTCLIISHVVKVGA